MKARWILLAICGGGAIGLGLLWVLTDALLGLWCAVRPHSTERGHGVWKTG